jgi:pimeloyl-ACP methyl ester carboxylesterase
MKQQRLVLLAGAMSLALASLALPAAAASTQASSKPTIVLVHGAFADSSSWDGVTAKLLAHGYPVVGVANPLRGVASDAAAVSDIVKGITGPVVLVGHSYGGSVISQAANGNGNVKSLVFVSAFAPEAGETAIGLTGKFPGSTLPPTLAAPVALAGGGVDLYIRQDKFPQQFAADIPLAKAALMAAGQRPIAEAALKEAAGEPAWKNVPSYFVYGKRDRNIPPAALSFMAERAHSRHTVAIDGASHVVMTSHPAQVAKLIEEAAAAQ